MINKTINWEHHVTRRLAVQVAIAWNYGYGELFNKRYRTGVKNTLVYYDGKKTDYFVDETEFKQFNKDIDKLLDNPEFVAGLIPEAKEFVEGTYEYIKELTKGAEKLSNKELAELYSLFSYHHANYYTRMWMGFRVCQRIVLKIESMLKEILEYDKKVKEFSRIFSTPLKPNDVTNERIDMLKIAVKINKLSDNKIKNLLLEHTRKYQHIPMFDFDHEPYKFEHFTKELDNIKNVEGELKKIENSFKERKKEFDVALEKLNPDLELSNLIIMLKKAAVFRDYRDMVRQKLNLSIREFYKVIGARIGLNIRETALLTNDEIEKHLLNSINFSKKEVKNRKESFLLFHSNDKVEIYSGNAAQDNAAKLNLYEITEEIKTLKGVTASPGSITGVAKIVHTNLDFDKIKEGDIIIAAMTRQDFVPVMRKVSAIVTNEGGVACHAAIIARELNLPCIVGTGNATQIINDGDLISIDSEKSIIQILKRK